MDFVDDPIALVVAGGGSGVVLGSVSRRKRWPMVESRGCGGRLGRKGQRRLQPPLNGDW
ncbi:hypothetical protein SESBI_39701 [Sesbania bispinosa]|nr:hypothetical protein SESBI_39701 [Sesbania bispinosa]